SPPPPRAGSSSTAVTSSRREPPGRAPGRRDRRRPRHRLGHRRAAGRRRCPCGADRRPRRGPRPPRPPPPPARPPPPSPPADPRQAPRSVVDPAEALGGLDILVNNAGILLMAPLLEITVEDWDRTFAVNVRSMLCTIQAAVPFMEDAGGGKIVNLASMGGKVGAPNQAHYASSKAAVIELTRVAAMELGPLGITVHCICPGYVLTHMRAATRTPEMVAAWTAKSPLGRLATTDDVAAMALFLASPASD